MTGKLIHPNKSYLTIPLHHLRYQTKAHQEMTDHKLKKKGN